MAVSDTNIRERFIDENDDKNTFHLLRSQDCEKIMEAVAAIPPSQRARMNTQRAHKYLGSVPNVVALNWAKEWGVALYSREWNDKAANRMKNDPEWNRLRAEQSNR